MVSPVLETIHVVMVMVGADSATEGAMTIKSALMHTSRPISFHIICSDDAIPIISKKIRLFSRPAYPVEVFFRSVSVDAIKARAARGGVGTDHHAGYGGFAKVSLANVVPLTLTKLMPAQAFHA